MNRRFFFTALAVLAAFPKSLFAKPIAKRKRYITRCPWDKLPGVRFEWTQDFKGFISPNQVPNSDWEILMEAPRVFYWNNYPVSNKQGNKFIAVAINNRSVKKLLCFMAVRLPNGESDRRFADLSVARFYVMV